MRFLLDVDEVLADFIGGACKLFGINRDQLISFWTPGRWDEECDIRTPLSQCLGLDKPMEALAFWSHFQYNRTFWMGLEVLPWARELLSYIQSITNDWYIVTAPTPFSDKSGCTEVYAGKLKWLYNNFKIDSHRVIITPHKHLLAQPGVVLIDDRESTIEHFRKANGIGYVFPAHHNRAGHIPKSSNMSYMRHLLEPYKGEV